MSTSMVPCRNPAHAEKQHKPTSAQGVECALLGTGRPSVVTQRVSAAPPAPAAPAAEEREGFDYADLSSNAKDAVKERISRERWDTGEMRETFEDVTKEVLEKAGIGYEAGSLTHSDLYSQGGHPAFAGEGVLDLGEPHGIHSIDLKVRHHGGSSTSVEVDFGEFDRFQVDDTPTPARDSALRAAEDRVSSLVDKVFWKLREADEVTDEDAADYASANEMTFDEDGNLL